MTDVIGCADQFNLVFLERFRFVQGLDDFFLPYGEIHFESVAVESHD